MKNLALDIVKMKLVSSSFFHFVDVYGALPMVSTVYQWYRTQMVSHFLELPGGPVVETPYFHCRGHGQGTKILHAVHGGQKKSKKKKDAITSARLLRTREQVPPMGPALPQSSLYLIHLLCAWLRVGS